MTLEKEEMDIINVFQPWLIESFFAFFPEKGCEAAEDDQPAPPSLQQGRAPEPGAVPAAHVSLRLPQAAPASRVSLGPQHGGRGGAGAGGDRGHAEEEVGLQHGLHG